MLRAYAADILICFLTVVVIPGVPWLFAQLSAISKASRKSKWLKEIEERGGAVAKTAVLAALQTSVAELKKAKDASSPGGATITAEEGKRVFQSTLQSALDSLGSSFVRDANKVLGAGTVEANLTAKIEAAVLMAKAQGLALVASSRKAPAPTPDDVPPETPADPLAVA